MFSKCVGTKESWLKPKLEQISYYYWKHKVLEITKPTGRTEPTVFFQNIYPELGKESKAAGRKWWRKNKAEFNLEGGGRRSSSNGVSIIWSAQGFNLTNKL